MDIVVHRKKDKPWYSVQPFSDSFHKAGWNWYDIDIFSNTDTNFGEDNEDRVWYDLDLLGHEQTWYQIDLFGAYSEEKEECKTVDVASKSWYDIHLLSDCEKAEAWYDLDFFAVRIAQAEDALKKESGKAQRKTKGNVNKSNQMKENKSIMKDKKEAKVDRKEVPSIQTVTIDPEIVVEQQKEHTNNIKEAENKPEKVAKSKQKIMEDFKKKNEGNLNKPDELDAGKFSNIKAKKNEKVKETTKIIPTTKYTKMDYSSVVDIQVEPVQKIQIDNDAIEKAIAKLKEKENEKIKPVEVPPKKLAETPKKASIAKVSSASNAKIQKDDTKNEDHINIMLETKSAGQIQGVKIKSTQRVPATNAPLVDKEPKPTTKVNTASSGKKSKETDKKENRDATQPNKTEKMKNGLLKKPNSVMFACESNLPPSPESMLFSPFYYFLTYKNVLIYF